MDASETASSVRPIVRMLALENLKFILVVGLELAVFTSESNLRVYVAFTALFLRP